MREGINNKKMHIPKNIKVELLELSPEEKLRYNFLSLLKDHTEEEHEEYLNFIKRCEGIGGEFLDDEELQK